MCRNSRFDVHFDHIAQAGRGEVVDYLVVTPQRLPESLITGVSVLPIVNDRLVLLRMYRHPVATTGLEVSRGFIDQGETPAQAALRELREETGLACRPQDLISLGTCTPEAGVLRARMALFVATGCRPAGGDRDTAELGLGDTVSFSRDEARALLSQMTIEDATTVIALHRTFMAFGWPLQPAGDAGVIGNPGTFADRS